MVIICGIDPGYQGGISIIKEDDTENPIIYKMPVIKNIKKVKGKTKTKQSYDLLEIRRIFNKHLDKNSIFFIEKVFTRPGEGSVSSFNFGFGCGNLEGLIVGIFNKKPITVSPQIWKKCFPELTTNEMLGIKAEMKELRLISKTLEDKDQKKENKKYIEKLGRNFKSLAKNKSRELASRRYPELSDKFQKKNTDGIAESLLIAIYGRLQDLQ